MNATPEPISCPGCNETVAAQYFERTYFSKITHQRYLLYLCRHCDLAFWWPRLLRPELYQSATLPQYNEYHEGQRPFPPWVHSFFELIPIRSGQLLDVGCGDGAFLARAASFGFKVRGIDLDEHSIRVAQDKHGLQDVAAMPLDTFLQSAKVQGHHYDVICFFEVLEHQAEPGAFLETIQDIVAPDGYIAGSVPNRKRFLAKLDRMVAPGDLPPHHFLWFSAHALTNILRRYGFHGIDVVPSGNIGFRSLLTKVVRLAISKLSWVATRYTHLYRAMLYIVMSPIVVILWLGLKLQPAHLYFQARSAKKL